MGHRVFIIHGRDLEARAELIKLIQALGLEQLSFEEVANELGPAPFVADVVLKGINEADAVLGLFTPDEQAALYDPVTGKYQGMVEHESRWQARPNVIFEAGVAYGIARERTILLTLGSDVRLFSDLSGVHFIDLSRDRAKRDLDARLRRIIRTMEKPPDNWEDPSISGDFKRCLRARWPHYDELHELEDRLSRQNASGRSSVADVVRSVVRQHLGERWEDWSCEMLMRAVSAKYAETTTDNTFWWLLIYGFIRFKNTEDWYDDDPPTWHDSVEYTEISMRGLRLLKKMALELLSEIALCGS